MERTPATTPRPASAEPPGTSGQAETGATDTPPGFVARGSLRRRARFLRKARELAYRDLGGLVFNLHRFGQRNDGLVLAKLSTLGQIDAELRALEASLQESQPATVLREAGITACPRCAAIHGSEDSFCPNCGLPMSRRVDLPIAGPASAPATTAAAAASSAAAGASTPAGAASSAAGAASGAPAQADAPAGAASAPAAPASAPASAPPLPPTVGAPPASAASPGRTPAPGPPPAQPPQTPSTAPIRRAGDDEATEVVRPPSRSA